jgi:hypothetical protein
MMQAPVPVELLLKEGVLEYLLELVTELATCFTPSRGLEVPASCVDQATGVVTFLQTYGAQIGRLVRILLVCA